MTQVTIPVQTWTDVSSVACKFQIKFNSRNSRMFYLEQSTDPSETFPSPKISDAILIMKDKNANYGHYIDGEYNATQGDLWVYLEDDNSSNEAQADNSAYFVVRELL